MPPNESDSSMYGQSVHHVPTVPTLETLTTEAQTEAAQCLPSSFPEATTMDRSVSVAISETSTATTARYDAEPSFRDEDVEIGQNCEVPCSDSDPCEFGAHTGKAYNDDDDEPSMEDEESHNDEKGGNGDDSDQTKNDTSSQIMDLDLENPSLDGRGRGGRHVSFSTVQIREYKQTVGVNPFCSYGCPISLDWEYQELDIEDLRIYEADRPPRRSRHGMLLSYYQRRDTLLLSGHSMEDLDRATKESGRERFRREMTITFLPVFILEEKLVLKANKVFGGSKNGSDSFPENGSQCSDVETGHRRIVRRTRSALDSSLNSIRSLDNSLHSLTDSFRESLAPVVTKTSSNRTRRRKRKSLSDAESMQLSNEESSRSGNSDFGSNASSDLYLPSHDSKFKGRYHVRVDRSQHDKAIEIRLCQIKRPHMRAFHASWISFFTAFFLWFAVTPLLGEIKDTLVLSKEQVWTSSLCGTAGTILMRLVLGPLCDKFGARLCMASILLVSAIPCAMTGLVESAEGLYIARAFIGIAGASFVACQYWTSSMFSREVAGTANALVAGWGNLGGGVTQIVMGSVVFPILKQIYGGPSNEESAEQAWRTSFVVPSILAIIVAFAIVYSCDDSPKGDYRSRVRAQEIAITSPCNSFLAGFANWNAWALMLQYACCFGVEVTMINAAALYFKERFGQSTESAAAIASIFGFMNLFARGLGGHGSDLYNTRYGMRGRLSWQFATLVLEGGMIMIFGFARTLPGAIIALIFTSIMVQSAEGSTFGVVPYISRRYTGGIVGFVGAGGNIGGVMFAAIFRFFDDEKALYIMGAAAIASAFLSFTIKIKGHSSFATWLNFF